MAMKKSKSKSKTTQDIDALKHDVAYFASSIGLSSSGPPVSSSGFDDTDFRKTGPLKPHKQTPPDSRPKKGPPHKGQEVKKNNYTDTKEPNSGFKPQRGTRILSSVDNDNGNNFSNKAFDKLKNLPKLPMVKANALGVWYVDAAELEEKVIGSEGKKKVEITKLEEWTRSVEKKKELGERLLVQYVLDYESSRGKNGDIKMLIATQRSGTAADKVSAYSVMVGDNPVANMRSIDALLGMVTSKVGKRHSLTGFEVLKELFVSNLLPERKLKTLFQRPVNLLPETKDGYSLLLFWYWEECLKQRYLSIYDQYVNHFHFPKFNW